MAKVSVTCSWCHEVNERHPVLKTYCFNCGHRADVPQDQCDCRRCRRVEEAKRKPSARAA